MRKDFSRLPGEHIITWLLRCWDNGASSLELEGREAKQLGSLSREGGIDKAIGKKAQALSLWRRLLSSMRERYPFSEDGVCRPGKWTTMERGIQYLRELAVREMVYYDPDNTQLPTDPDEVQCTQPTGRKFVLSAPSSYANSLAVIDRKSEEAPTVDEVAGRLRQYEESLSSSLVSAVEKLSQDVRQLKEDISYSPPAQTRIAAVRMWIRWPGTSDPQEYKALVDTGAQCTLLPSNYEGVEPISISGVTGGSQQLTLLEAEVSLTGNDWQKHPIVTGPEAPCILGIDYLRKGYFKDPKGYRWAFGIAALEAEEIEPLSSLPGLSEDPSVVGLLRVEEQQVPIATTTVHRRQYCTNRDSLVPIHELIRQLEGQGVISRTRSPFNSPIWPVRKSNGEWRLTVEYRGLNEVTPPMSAAVPDRLELQYELESKAAKWYATIDIANAFFSIPLAAECRPQFAFTWRGVRYTWNRLPQGWKHSPTICHGLIQTALEKGEAPEHLQYIDDIIVWGNSAEEVSEKGKKIIQILLQAGFAINRNAHVPKSRATAEEHQNNQQVDQAAKIEVAQVDLDWQRKGELFIARWAHDTSGHQGRDATYRWARDRGVDLTMDAISEVIHECETCSAIKQAKRVKPLWYGGRWLKYKYGEAWQIDYITLPQSRQGKRHVLTMVEATTGWLETYPVPHATARNTILGLEKQVLW
ncbi:hypothetical protein GRJ2_003327800 [Grus japonensis]|uniref:ribonuclease H n=1 Tax=Grus japonensis TaxID=30415 RepID=A0ABC9YGA9_GRUJA